MLVLGVLVLAGCGSSPAIKPESAAGKIVCDSYIILDMCVRDLVGDGQADMIYFSDTREIFMYRAGMQDQVVSVMPLHRCAVPLDAEMQQINNRILERENLSLSQELGIKRQLIANFLAAKPEIDACNARFEDPDVTAAKEEEFFMGDEEWGDEDEWEAEP